MVGNDVIVSPRVMKTLSAYDWPGNVRELQNVMEHACIMRNDNLINMYSLPMKFQQPSGIYDEAGLEDGEITYNIKDMTEHLEKQLIIGALNQCTNRSEAIRELGISRSSFYSKIKQYHIDLEDAPE